MPPSSPAPQAEYFAKTVAMVREVLESRLRAPGGTDDHVADMQALRVSLQELEVLWEEMQSQAERLAAQHQRYIEFFEQTPDAYLVTDVWGNIQEANRAAGLLLNLSPRSLILKPLQLFLAESDREVMRGRLNVAEMKATGEVREWDGEVLPKYGEPVAVSFRLRARSGADLPTALYWLIRKRTG